MRLGADKAHGIELQIPLNGRNNLAAPAANLPTIVTLSDPRSGILSLAPSRNELRDFPRHFQVEWTDGFELATLLESSSLHSVGVWPESHHRLNQEIA
jgi:hypothetical protein